MLKSDTNSAYKSIKTLLAVFVMFLMANNAFSYTISGNAAYAGSNDPITAGDVEFYVQDDITGVWSLIGTTSVNSSGHYVITGITTIDTVYAIIYPSDRGTQLDFVPTYYPDNTSWIYADVILPNNNHNITNVDILCEFIPKERPIIPTQTSTISGIVKGWNGAVVKSAIVYIRSGGSLFTSAVTDRNGAYSLLLPEGDYDVSVDKFGNNAINETIHIPEINQTYTHNFSFSNTGINSISSPKQFVLSQNYPNPFNPVTKISYTVPENSSVKLQIYDIAGKLISTLMNEFRTAGIYSIALNASEYPSGTYFYKLTANNVSITKKMMLIK